MKEHGYKDDKLDETKKMYRFRQENPNKFQTTSFRTVKLSPGIQAIIARPINGKVNSMPKKKSKKKASKKRATKKRTSTKKSVKKKSVKKKSTKKKSNPRKKKTVKLKIELKSLGKTVSSSNPANIYELYIKNGRDKMFVGNVTAKNQTAAKKIARAYLKKQI